MLIPKNTPADPGPRPTAAVPTGQGWPGGEVPAVETAPAGTDDIAVITDRILNMLHAIPDPTELGNAFRRLGDRLDSAPSTLTGMKGASLALVMTTPEAVQKAAEDFGLRAVTYGEDPEWTTLTLTSGPLALSLIASREAVRELHRPVDVTETIEAQS